MGLLQVGQGNKTPWRALFCGWWASVGRVSGAKIGQGIARCPVVWICSVLVQKKPAKSRLPLQEERKSDNSPLPNISPLVRYNFEDAREVQFSDKVTLLRGLIKGFGRASPRSGRGGPLAPASRRGLYSIPCAWRVCAGIMDGLGIGLC